MNHCFKPCQVVYDDEYRTRFDCVICRKTFYQLKNRTSSVETKGTKTPDSRIDGTMVLVNGSPYVHCGWCTELVRLHDAKPIRILKDWEVIGQKYHYFKNPARNPQDRMVVPQWKPIIQQKPGCVKCQHVQAIKGKQHFFGGELKQDPPINGYQKKVEDVQKDHKVDATGTEEYSK